MTTSKKDLVKDLKFCKSLMDRLVDYAEANYRDIGYDRRHTVIQNDIIRLRRELNDVRNKLNWNYDER